MGVLWGYKDKKVSRYYCTGRVRLNSGHKEKKPVRPEDFFGDKRRTPQVRKAPMAEMDGPRTFSSAIVANFPLYLEAPKHRNENWGANSNGILREVGGLFEPKRGAGDSYNQWCTSAMVELADILNQVGEAGLDEMNLIE